ncbi:MAG: hypothetical protein OXN17_11895 [Candidatus Poribacteria bacterium]|nr:hypothetical protein [Candidatus Poribacteria bacterium]MDE0504792.1 hypothetical protein [Candidatus Poribacteria bacterium]
MRNKTRNAVWLFIVFFTIYFTGCATTYVPEWRSQLWTVPDVRENQTQAFGALESSELRSGIICTLFREVGNPTNTIVAVTASCRNTSTHPYYLESNPIQVIDAARNLLKPLTVEHAMYKFYGGALFEQAQIDRLTSPMPDSRDYSDSIFGSALYAIAVALRSEENRAIISNLLDKESLPYDLYHRSFEPVTISPGVSTQWTQFFLVSPTDKTISVMLEGDDIDNAISFVRPIRPPPRKAAAEDGGTGVAVFVFAAAIFTLIVMLSNSD